MKKPLRHEPTRRRSINPSFIKVSAAALLALGAGVAWHSVPPAGAPVHHSDNVPELRPGVARPFGDGTHSTAAALAANRPATQNAIMATERRDMQSLPARQIIASAWGKDPEPKLAAFTEWTRQYFAKEGAVAAGERVKPEVITEGVRLSAARREALKDLIVTDPQRALAAAVPAAAREKLPAGVRANLENRVSGFGDVYRLHTMPLPGGKAVPSRDLAQVDGRSFEAYRSGTRELVPRLHGVSIHGVEIDGKLAVLDSPVRVLEGGETLEGKPVNEACPVSGEVVETVGKDAVEEGETTTFAVGNQLYETCSPNHVGQIDEVLAKIEKSGGSTLAELTNRDMQALYVHTIRALSDSAVAGETGYIGKPPTSLTHGGKNVLIMRVQPTEGGYPGWATDSMFSDTVWRADGWNNRMKRTSYDKAWLTRADITPIMTLPQNEAYYVGSGYNWGRWLDDSKAAAAAQGYNLSDYACFVVAHKDYGFGAAGWGGGGAIWCNGNFDVRLFVHEYGHVFWLPHANSWTSTDGNPMSPSRSHVEYGDAADPMGNAWGAALNNEYGAYYKNFCGWLPDAAVQTVSRNGTYRIYQNDGSTALNRTLTLKVARDYELNYWISFRGEPIGQNAFNNGASILAVSAHRTSDSHLVDMNNPSGDTHNAPLALNQSWYDSSADITFRTASIGGTSPNRYLDLEVTFGNRYTGGYRPLVSGGIYRLKNRHNGKYLDVPNNSSANNVAVQVWDGNGSAAQNWVATRNSDGTYSFNHQGTDKWLDVVNNSGNDGAEIIQHARNTSDAQKWYVNMNPEGYLFITHRGTEKVLDMDPGGVNDVHQWGFNAGAWQQWYPELMGIVPGNYRVLPRHAQGSVLDVAGVNPNSGAELHIWNWVGGANQQWGLADIGSGRFRFTPLHSTGQSMDVSGGSAGNGARAITWTYSGVTSQRWSFTRTDGNWVRLTPDHAPNSCLDVAGGPDFTGNGTATHLWTWLNGTNQQWRFVDVDL